MPLNKQPPQQYKYALSVLEAAADILEIQRHYVINPRMMYCTNLMYSDDEWRQDFNLYLHTLRFWREKLNPKEKPRGSGTSSPPVRRRRR